MKKSTRARQGRNTQRLRDDIRRNTFYMHGTMMASAGAEVGNPKHTITKADAVAILNRRNTWAIMIVVFLDNGLDQIAKLDHHTITEHKSRSDINAQIDQLHWDFVGKQNLNHVCSSGFFLVPDHTIDLQQSERDAIRLFSLHKPWDRDHTEAATMIRQLERMTEAA